MKRPFPEIIMPDTGKPYRETVEPKQKAFHTSKSRFRLMSGAYGAGKSAAAVIEILKECWIYPGNYGYVVRQSFKKIDQTILKDIRNITPPWMVVQQHKTSHWIDLLNYKGLEYIQENKIKNYRTAKMRERLIDIKGVSRIQFQSFQNNIKAEDQFSSANIGWFMIEQAETASYEIYKYLVGRARMSHASGNVILVANPTGRDWLWDIFSPESPNKLDGHDWWIFETKDNPHLPPHYIEGMKLTYSEDEIKRLLHGDYNVAIDAIFPELSQSHHYIPYFKPPEDWPKAVGIDHGLENPTAAVFLAENPKSGDIFAYGEYYEKDKITSEHVAALLPQLTKQHKCRVIDPTAANRQGTDKNSVVLEYNKLGLPLAPSSRDKPAGIIRLKEYLRIDPERTHTNLGHKGAPRLYIMNNCTKLWDQLLRYKWEQPKSGVGDENKPEKAKKKHDHLPDALRFAMISFANALTKNSVVKDQHSPERWRIAEAKENSNLVSDAEGKIITGKFTIEKDIEKSLTEPTRPGRVTTWLAA